MRKSPDPRHLPVLAQVRRCSSDILEATGKQNSATMGMPPSHGMNLSVPPIGLVAWANCFRAAEIPVLGSTAAALEAYRANEEHTDANGIGEMISSDPLMTLKVLAYESGHRGRRVVTPAETVTSALVMMGISPFFRAFGPQPTIEDWLVDRPEAMAGLQKVLRRAYQGAEFALAFAIHRTDPHAAVIHASALLHEFAEMLLWCHAPELALKVQTAQLADPTLRSNVAQQDILHVELGELQRSLSVSWHLPALISDVAAPTLPAANISARIVELATRLARHSASGWDNPAIPDDIADVGLLLNLSTGAAGDFVARFHAADRSPTFE